MHTTRQVVKLQASAPSPTFLAPGTSFMGDNFSTDGVGAGGSGSGCNASDGRFSSGGHASHGERWGAADDA